MARGYNMIPKKKFWVTVCNSPDIWMFRCHISATEITRIASPSTNRIPPYVINHSIPKIKGYLQNEVGKYFYAERKIYSVLCKKWLKNITTHDMLFHAI